MRHGFSLTELLIVVGIIAILASILLPTLKLVRTMARTAVCAASMRQAGLGTMAYSVDHRGLMPRTRSSGGTGWIGSVSPYVESSADDGSQNAVDGSSIGNAAQAARRDVLWGCPEWAGNRLRMEYASSGFFYNGFGMNAWLAATSTGTAAQNGKHNYFSNLHDGIISSYPASDFHRAGISHASSRLLIRDSGEDWIGNHGLSGTDTAGMSEPWAYVQIIKSARHRGRYNVAFVDGRIAQLDESGAYAAVVHPDLQP